MNRDKLIPRLRAVQYIGFALITGMVVICGALAVLRLNDPLAKPLVEIGVPLWVIPLGLLPVMILISGLVAKQMVHTARNANRPIVEGSQAEPESNRLAVGILLGKHVIRFAFLESVGILGAIAFYLEGNPLAFLAPGGAILWMIVTFPSIDRLEQEYEKLTSGIGNRESGIENND
jgi:hypothetical protein